MHREEQHSARGEGDIVAHLLETECSPSAAQEKIASLKPEVLRNVLDTFSSQSRSTRSTELLRFLWLCPGLQPSILAVICCLNDCRDLSTQRLFNEVEVLLGADARNGSKSPEARIQLISACATAVCLQSKRGATPAAISVLVFCAHAAAQIHTQRGHAVQNRIIRYILRLFENPTQLRLSPVVAMLETDFPLGEFEDIAFMRVLDSFVSLRCEDGDVPAVFLPVVSRLGRVTSARQITTLGLAALNLLSKVTPSSLSNALDVLYSINTNFQLIASRLVDSLSDLMNSQTKNQTLMCAKTKIGPAHISLVFSLLTSTGTRNTEEKIKIILEELAIPHSVPFDRSQIASSSATASEPPFVSALRFIARKEIPAIWANGETIACVFEGQVWSSKTFVRDSGVRMLFEAFVIIPRSRKRILRAILTALTNAETPDSVCEAFSGLLERICEAREAALYARGFSGDLHALLDFADAIPMHVDCKVVAAIARLSVGNPQLSDRVISFLRKSSGSRLFKLQRIAAAGFLTLIEHDIVSDETRKEVTDAFGEVFALAETPLRAYLFHLMLQYVDRHQTRSNRIQVIANLVEQYISNACMKCSFCDRKSIHADQAKTVGSRHAHMIFGLCCGGDDIALGMRLCQKLIAHCSSLARFYEEFGDYLRNAEKVLQDFYSASKQKGPTKDKFTQLRELYQMRICLDPPRSRECYLSSFAICLVVRALDEAHNRGETSFNQKSKTADSIKRFAILDSVSAREAAAIRLPPVFEKDIADSLSLEDCITVLQLTVRSSMAVFFRRVVFLEFFSVAVKKIRSSNSRYVLNAEELEKLVDLINKCYIATSPWTKDRSERQNAPCSENALADVEERLSSSLSSDKQTSFTTHPWDCKTCLEKVSSVLPNDTISENLAGWNSAAVSAQLSKLTSSLRIAIRSSCLAVFIIMVQDSSKSRRFVLFQSIMREVELADTEATKSDSTHLSAESNNRTVSEPASSNCNLREKEKEDLNGIDMACRSRDDGTGSSKEVCILRAAQALSQAFCLEFQYSMSAALTLTYLDLFFWLRRESEEDSESEKGVRKIIVSTMSGILHDFSIRHSTVLRRMVSLLMDSFDVSQGLEFATAVICGLRDEIVLDDRFGENIGTIRANDFDIDIIEEAIDLDTQLDEIGKESALPPNSYSMNHHSATNAPKSSLQEKQGGWDQESIRKLCLGETEDNAITSILCMLEYLLRLVRKVLVPRRRLKSKFRIPSQDDGVSLTSILNALRELLPAQFMQLSLVNVGKNVALLWKRLGEIIQNVTELAELELRSVPTHLCTQEGEKQPISGIADLLHDMLSLLFKEGYLKLILSSALVVEQRTRTVFLQEKLDASATAFVLCHENETCCRLQKILHVLQERVAQIGARKSGANETSDIADSVHIRADFHSRPKKRPHVRSRNRYIDGWLAEENGDDNYVDLEDFIVPLDGDAT